MTAPVLALVWPVTKDRTPRPRSRRPQTPRAALLSVLRRQRRKLGSAYFVEQEAPDLYALAMAADRVPRNRKTFVFRGVRFGLMFSNLRRYVLDPDTGATLIGGGFLA